MMVERERMTGPLDRLLIKKMTSVGFTPQGVRSQGGTPKQIANYLPRHGEKVVEQELKKLAGFDTAPVERVSQDRYRISDVHEAQEFMKDDVWWA